MDKNKHIVTLICSVESNSRINRQLKKKNTMVPDAALSGHRARGIVISTRRINGSISRSKLIGGGEAVSIE